MRMPGPDEASEAGKEKLMPPHDDSARDPVRLHEEPWAAESPFISEAAAGEQAPIDPWYQGYTLFVEGRELEETYAPEAVWESDLAALEAESPFQNAFVEGRTGLVEPEELEEGLVVEEGLPLQGQSLQALSSQECQKRLKSTSVAVVGGGLGGLMAARELGQRGIKVTVFEARSQVGGRVLSNRKFSNGRITEEGAELIGSFHTEWLTLAQKYGLAVISRMDDGLYWRACLNVKLTLDEPLTTKQIDDLWKEAETRVLKPIARLASQIRDPSQPWLEPGLKNYDGTSVAYALEHYYKVKPTERLWKAMEFLLVNNEVAPLDRMNFLGLLCKVKAGQGARCSAVDTGPGERLMGYWNELEIFRSADGCQELANKLAEEIRTKHGKYGSKVLLSTAVTHIGLSKQGVVLGSRKVVDEVKGKLADKPLPLLNYDYVILAIPPSVWADVKITADGKDAHPKDEIGLMGMGPAVKFFSDMKERFWIKKNAAPSGGSLTLGQVWEGTDNQTRVGNQGIVLSVFAGPIIPTPIVAGGADRRAPNPGEFDKELKKLYPAYTRNRNKWRFADWPNVAFIKTGYASPAKDDIFKLGEKLSEPFRDRLFFAGEHTHTAFFGYMEGALRSGKRAANKLMLQSCGLLKKPAPASSEPPRVASAAPIRTRTASEYETDIPLKEHSTTDYPAEAESPFFHQEHFVGESEQECESRAAALASESPFLDTVNASEERSGSAIVPEVYEEESNEPEAIVEPEFGELYKETEGLESDEEELDWLTEDSGEEESERVEEESVEVELDIPKRGAKKSSLHSVPTTDVFMHVYFKKLDAGYTGQQFFDWIVGQSPGEMGPNRFQLAGVDINLVNNSSTAVSDFKGSLKAAGSLVVYFGHTVLGPKTTLGLAPNDPPVKKPGITCAELTKLLDAAKAKIVVLAGCATSQCVTKIKGDTVVIVTQSGKDRLTNTLQWAPAIKALLDELLASSTVGDALAAANKSFAKASSTDSFKMINGDPTLKMI
jgi:monoamine oxidase